MYMKITGAILIILSSYIMGIYYSQKDNFKREDLEEIRRGLSIVKDEIMFLSMPLAEAFSAASEKLAGGVSGIFSDIGRGIKEEKDESLPRVISKAVENNISQTFMKKEDADILVYLGKTMGDMDSDHQRAGIDMALSDLEDSINALKEKSVKNEKMYSSIFVLGGILVAVLLM